MFFKFLTVAAASVTTLSMLAINSDATKSSLRAQEEAAALEASTMDQRLKSAANIVSDRNNAPADVTETVKVTVPDRGATTKVTAANSIKQKITETKEIPVARSNVFHTYLPPEYRQRSSEERATTEHAALPGTSYKEKKWRSTRKKRVAVQYKKRKSRAARRRALIRKYHRREAARRRAVRRYYRKYYGY